MGGSIGHPTLAGFVFVTAAGFARRLREGQQTQGDSGDKSDPASLHAPDFKEVCD